jgi:protein gp37
MPKRAACANLADVFDNQIAPAWRTRLWELIGTTFQLDGFLLTKRPQKSDDPEYRPWIQRWPWPSVWLGSTAENQGEADGVFRNCWKWGAFSID